MSVPPRSPSRRWPCPTERLDQLVAVGHCRRRLRFRGPRRPGLEVDTVDEAPAVAAVVAALATPVTVKFPPPGSIRRIDGQRHLAADHQFGVRSSLVSAGVGRRPCRGGSRDPSAIEHFIQLVADEDDAMSLGGQASEGSKTSWVSCGVRTAVGSSRTRAVRHRGRAPSGGSSTRCQPTDSEPTLTSGSTSNSKRRPRSTMRLWASLRSRKPPRTVVSSPRTMFSATVRTGTSMKCLDGPC